MKNLFFATSMAFAVISTASQAADLEPPAQTFGTSGYAELYGFYTIGADAGSNTENWDFSGLGGGGHVNFWLNDNWTLQIDGGGDFFRAHDGGSQPTPYRVFAVEALVHAGWRDPEQGYVGAFGGLLSHGFSSVGNTTSNNSYDQYVIGGEGAFYWDMMTFFAQGGFMDAWSEDGSSSGPQNSFTDTWFMRGGLRYFANPNMKLEASGGILSGNEYTSVAVDMPFWHFEGEYKPDDSRVSWFVSYGGYSEDETGVEHTGHTIAGGVRVHFGQETLMSFDRSGASLDFFDTRMLVQAFDH